MGLYKPDGLNGSEVPAWIPRAAGHDGYFYVWSVRSTSLVGRLWVEPRSDRDDTIHRLIEQAERIDEDDDDLDLNVAFVELRAGAPDGANRGVGYGRLFRPEKELRFTLREMLRFACEQLCLYAV